MTPELRKLRLGKLTASEADVVMGGLETKGLDRLVRRAAFERVYGDHGEDGYSSWAMQRGDELEAVALDDYEFTQLCEVERSVLVPHQSIPNVGATPDALRKNFAGIPLLPVEAKSLTHAVWIEVLLRQQAPAEYRWQCRWQAWCCEAPLVHFWAHHPVSGGILIPFEVEQEYFDRMRERVVVVESLIQDLMHTIRERRS